MHTDVRQNIAVALNEAAQPAGLDVSRVCALNVELQLGEDGSVPEWVELIPAGRQVTGRDGREWLNDQPEAIAAAFRNDFGPIPIGFGHAIETAELNQAPPAAAWIEALEVRDGGAIWGQVAWNTMGRYSVAAREYRYLSPTFAFDKSTRRILQLLAAGLTNWPNLHLTALNGRESPKETDAMDKQLLAALGLPDNATLEQALNAIQNLKDEKQTALNQAQTPSLERFVPRADYDVAVNAQKAAEGKLAEREQADQKQAIETEISVALNAKKISPATADYYRAMCAQDGGLERFREFIKAAPVLAPDQVIQGDPEKPGGASKLNADELAVCQQLGVTPESFIKARELAQG